MYRSWAFYRRSTDRQELSLDAQRKACLKKAEECGCIIVKEFTPEKGYASGLTIEHDPAFQSMLKLAETPGHDIRHLFIYDVSRFGRSDPKNKIYFEERFRRSGIKIIYAAEHFTNDNSLGDQLVQFVSHSEAHQYSLRLSTSTIRGCKDHAALGHSCGGRPPYGYDRLLLAQGGTPVSVLHDGQHKSEKTQHIILTPGDSQKQAIVRRIFELYNRGNGLGNIVNLLNAEGIPSPRGGGWAKHTISSILKNRAYIGTRVYFKHNYHNRSDKSHAFVRSPEQWIVKENAHEPIIDRELFDRVQAKFVTYKPRDGRHHDSPYLLGGIVYCTRCKHRYYGQHKYHLGKKTPYYLCGGYHSKGTAFCESFSVPASVLESFAVQEIQKRIAQPQFLERIQLHLRDYIDKLAQSNDLQELANRTKNEITKNKEGISNIVSAITISHSPHLVAELTRLEEQQKTLEAKLGELMPVSTATQTIGSAVKEMVGYLEMVPDILAGGTLAERKNIIKAFVERVEVSSRDKQAKFVMRQLPFLPKKIAGPFAGADDHFPGILYRSRSCGGWI